MLREGLQAQPQQCDRLTALIVDTRDQLAALVPKRSPAGQRLLADMMDKLDEVRQPCFPVTFCSPRA